jgi:DNA-binding MarR family transcriptional regulator
VTLPFDPVDEARRNWLAHGWGAVGAMAAVTSLARAWQIALARADDVLRPMGLTFSRFEALALLHFSRRGGLPMGVIGERLQVHPASVTNTVGRLQDAGLVRRTPHPSDGRAVIAEITDEGRAAVAAAAAALAEVRFGLAGLDDVECAAVEDALRALRRRAGDFDGA